MNIQTGSTIQPNSIEQLEPFLLVGIKTRTTNAKETSPITASIHGHWQRFFAENVAMQIPNKAANNKVFGVYTDYESDMRGEYSLVIGCEVMEAGNIPEGLCAVTIPAGKYMRFPAIGEMPRAVIDAWGEVWRYFADTTLHQRAYTADFELYNDEEAVIFIAIV